MMPLRLQIDEKLERTFRELAMKKFGFMKGSLSLAAEEAILNWIATVEKGRLVFEGDPVEAIDGLLAGIGEGSVGLQHKIGKAWSKRVLDDAPA